MRWLLLLILLPAACSKGAEADLASIGEARSLAAEWALVNEQAGKGRLTTTYTDTMREQLREQLQAPHPIADPAEQPLRGGDRFGPEAARRCVSGYAPCARRRAQADRRQS